MKNKTALLRWLTVAAVLTAASNFAQAASKAAFSDSWKDSFVSSQDVVDTTGSFSVSIALPLDGVDLSETDSNSQFSLSIGPSGATIQIVSDTLGDAEEFSASKKSAKFPLTTQNSDGNEITNGSLAVSWTATTITVTATAKGDVLGEEAIFAEASSGTPTSYTLNTTATGIYYEISLTLDASDNGGGVFNYDNPYVPVTGSDKETEANPTDGTGPYPLENGSLKGAANLTPPALKISSPAASSKVTDANPVVDLVGTASDSEGIINIECDVNGDTNNPIPIDQAEELPTNKLAWTAEVDLSQFGQVGSNLVTVMAVDLSGNQSSLSRTVLWLEMNSAVVTVSPTGAGTVKGLKDGQALQVGENYLVAATAANKNWIFSYWSDASGDILSSNVTFEYLDTSSNAPSVFETDGTLIANFAQNPFNNSDLAGTYTGLFSDTNNGAEVYDAGYITVKVTGTGGFSGKLHLAAGNASFSISGQLSVTPDGSLATAEFPIKDGKAEYLEVVLQFATDTNLTDPGAGMMGGYVNAFAGTNFDAAGIQGELSLYDTNVPAGLYNFVMPPVSSDPSQGPGGYSYGSATVSKEGAAKLVLNLADGTSPAISFSSSLAYSPSLGTVTCPFYASLYSGQGVILGWLQFATDGSDSIQQEAINWIKLPVADKYYTSGFTMTPSMSLSFGISGGLYIPPKAGANIFGEGATALTFEIDPGYDGLNLTNEIDDNVTFNPARNTFTGETNGETITLTASTGVLKGAFPSVGKTAFTYHGVVVDGAGYGFYTDAALKETGPIWIGAPPSIDNGGHVPPGQLPAAPAGGSSGLMMETLQLPSSIGVLSSDIAITNAPAAPLHQ